MSIFFRNSLIASLSDDSRRRITLSIPPLRGRLETYLIAFCFWYGKINMKHITSVIEEDSKIPP